MWEKTATVCYFTMNFKKEVLRKSLHTPGVLFLLLSYYYYWTSLFVLLLLIVSYFISTYLHDKRGIGIPYMDELTQFLKREEKIDLGPPLLGIGIFIVLLFFKFNIATCAVLQVCIADSTACLSGKFFGEKKVFYSSQKTYLGCFVFFLTAFLVQLPFISPLHSLLLAIAGMFLESLPFGAWDNFLIPVGIALLALWIGI